jgi:hypothetical protein
MYRKSKTPGGGSVRAQHITVTIFSHIFAPPSRPKNSRAKNIEKYDDKHLLKLK